MSVSAGTTRRDTISGEDIVRLRLFANASREAVEGLLHACPIRELEAGAILLAPGQTNRALYSVLEGRLRIHLDAPDNQPIGIVDAGESVGELSVIDQKPTAAFVIADTTSRLLVIDQEIFWSLIHASHVVACNMLVSLAQRLRNNNSAVSESKRLQQLYKRHAATDELTGLYNRRWLMNLLKRQVTRSSMNQKPLSVIMVDVDHFKTFNDEFGHIAGDHALYAVAQTMLNIVRPTDMVGRYGGEEFAVMLPDTDIKGAHIAAERIRQAVSEAVIVMSDQSILPSVTISLGVAQMRPFETLEALIEASDAALYRAKKLGRNRVSD